MVMQMEEIKFNYNLGNFGDTMNRVILRDYPHKTKDFVESFLSNQIRCKTWLVQNLASKLAEKKDHFNPTRITILGSWYGNVIVPLIIEYMPYITEIDLVDMDEDTLLIARKFMMFTGQDKVKINYMCEDINFMEFDDFRTDIVINTSCEHMFPMSSVSFKNDNDVVYALQSNDMVDVREHVNCVQSESELAEQANLSILYYSGSKNLKGSESTYYNRFMVIGKRS